MLINICYGQNHLKLVQLCSLLAFVLLHFSVDCVLSPNPGKDRETCKLEQEEVKSICTYTARHPKTLSRLLKNVF